MYSAYDTLAGGLPPSDIHGSTPARGSPWLFAACHVLHRLLVPRHPPNALLVLDIQPTMHRSHPHPNRGADRTAHARRTQHTHMPCTPPSRAACIATSLNEVAID